MQRVIVIGAAVGAAVLGLMLVLPSLMAGSRQLVRGGCLVNIGDGCNVYVTQSYSIPESVITSPLVIALALAVLLLGGLWLWASRGSKPQ